MHPILINALAKDRCRWCPCGGITRQRHHLCSECQAVAAWQQDTTWASHSVIPSWKCAKKAKTWLFAKMTLLLQIIGKGAENRCSLR